LIRIIHRRAAEAAENTSHMKSRFVDGSSIRFAQFKVSRLLCFLGVLRVSAVNPEFPRLKK
jgi:hypothetical protein